MTFWVIFPNTKFIFYVICNLIIFLKLGYSHMFRGHEPPFDQYIRLLCDVLWDVLVTISKF